MAQELSIDDLALYFHLPINEVAQELGICATVLKKVCRRLGIKRWPHRKFKSLDTLIEGLQAIISEDDKERTRIKKEIADLRSKREFLTKNPNTSYKSVVPKYCIAWCQMKVAKAQEEGRYSPPEDSVHSPSKLTAPLKQTARHRSKSHLGTGSRKDLHWNRDEEEDEWLPGSGTPNRPRSVTWTSPRQASRKRRLSFQLVPEDQESTDEEMSSEEERGWENEENAAQKRMRYGDDLDLAANVLLQFASQAASSDIEDDDCEDPEHSVPNVRTIYDDSPHRSTSVKMYQSMTKPTVGGKPLPSFYFNDYPFKPSSKPMNARSEEKSQEVPKMGMDEESNPLRVSADTRNAYEMLAKFSTPKLRFKMEHNEPDFVSSPSSPILAAPLSPPIVDMGDCVVPSFSHA